ncbi:Protein CLEC16A [Gossypium australe]|uniref:Protein CLEC16A n=1 Tax=Gossypium australe TaxID=47621 RepID=A0A5B6WVK2_9ROSI|nr:Protein CLEC16A [Gossypium australe]
MWFSFWRSRDRFSLDELRYLTNQLQKVQIVNDVNKDFVIEALRSIAELLTYGDQHDSSFFEFFMEKQVMGEFVRILNISKTVTVSLQLLQTISILIQNLRREHAIYYMFSNEHVNYLITYSFDFRNEELLSYYISFLRAISGKLNKNTISLLVKTQDEEVVSFPLYVEAIRFAFHEESMVRTAVRAITLNVYHVGDEFVNKFIASAPHSDYFSNLVSFFRDQCINLSKLFSERPKNPCSESVSAILAKVDEIEDNLYYFSDVISAGIPVVGSLITDNILQLLILPLLFPALQIDADSNLKIGAVTSLYLLCCILRIVKIKDLANTIAAALLYPLETFAANSEVKINGYVSGNNCANESEEPLVDSVTPVNAGQLCVDIPNKATSSQVHPGGIIAERDFSCSHLSLSLGWYTSPIVDEPLKCCSKTFTMKDEGEKPLFLGLNKLLRETLLSYVTDGDDARALGSLSVLATLLQTKGNNDEVCVTNLFSIAIFLMNIYIVELDESMLDGIGILPQRKQHKKLLLQALVGEGSGEEQLFSFESGSARDSISSELDGYLKKLKIQCLLNTDVDKKVKMYEKENESKDSHEEQYGVSIGGAAASPRIHRNQVLDALVKLLCRSDISTEILWDGGWLLRQLLPYSEAEFKSHHLKLLKDSYRNCRSALVQETKGIWVDLLITVLCDQWKKCKRAIEASSPRKEPKCILLPFQKLNSEDIPAESSFTAGERMSELVKVFVLLHQLQIFSLGRALPEQPPIQPQIDIPEISRARAAGLDVSGPKPGTEVKFVHALPCRIAFERGKERHFHFLAVSVGTLGWVLLAEELPLKQNYGIVRVAAPLAGTNSGNWEGLEPRIDDKHARWLHLRIRPSTLPFLDAPKSGTPGETRIKSLVDGRWTLAFRDDESCKTALSMILEEINLQNMEVERRLKPVLDLEL